MYLCEQEVKVKRGKKVHMFRPSHMTKMAAMLIQIKTLRNFLLQNHLADFLQTWYVAFVEMVLKSLYK